jgi:hypothetical protein
VIKLLASFLSLLDRFFSMWERSKIKQEGRQEAIKEVKDVVEANVEKAEAAVSVPDPERDERLRSRFDRSRSGK